MASAYNSGTENEASTAALGTALAEVIRDELIAHHAWELVEEFTPGAACWYVFKCLSSENDLGADFHLVMGRTVSTGELRFFTVEEYNPSTKECFGFGASNATSQVHDSLGRAPWTFTLGSSQISNSSNVPFNFRWNPSGTIANWWVIVWEDMFTVAIDGNNDMFFSVSAYIPLTPSYPNALPVVQIGVQTEQSSSWRGSICRNPAMADITGTAGSLRALAGGGSPNSHDAQVLGFVGRLDAQDKLQGDERIVAEVGVTVNPSQASDISVTGEALGKQKYMRVARPSSYPSGVAFFDTYVLNGTLWVPWTPNDIRIWNTGVEV